jgi:hypothetical protein
LSNSSIRQCCFNSTDPFFSSQYFLNTLSPYIDFSKNNIYLKLYSDEIEIVNPIGSARKKHKLLTFYFQIMNMPAYFLTKLDSIFLCFFCKETLVQKYSVEKILEPLVFELNVLYHDGFVHLNDQYFGIAV